MNEYGSFIIFTHIVSMTYAGHAKSGQRVVYRRYSVTQDEAIKLANDHKSLIIGQRDTYSYTWQSDIVDLT